MGVHSRLRVLFDSRRCCSFALANFDKADWSEFDLDGAHPQWGASLRRE